MGEGGKRYMIDTGEFRTPYAHYTIHAHTNGSARATSSPFKNRGVTEETFTRNARLASLTGLPSREISFFYSNLFSPRNIHSSNERDDE